MIAFGDFLLLGNDLKINAMLQNFGVRNYINSRASANF